ncbi:MAG: hypothetical protein ACE5Q3_05740 [Alphaproteobacteria bacterium]
MATIESWGGNIAEIGPIYPSFGLMEVLLWLVGLALWILWHIWQGRNESREYAREIEEYGEAGNYRKALASGDD